ncbi:hypothetical protein BG000_010167 [Podila horticola]|nr:hypothetical protein BG000_010167 [Podila horticola]
MVRLSSRAWLSALAVAVVAMAAPPVAAPPKVTAPTNATTTVASATHTSNFVLPSGAPGPKPTPPTTSGNQTMTQCPGPLIANTQGLKIKTCMGNCCIKCPAFESLYEPDEVQRVLRMAYYTRQVSLGFAVFMAISYLCLPGKKAQPHISVLFLTVSLSLWYAAFDIMPGVSNACANDFEQSTGHNSRLCGVQGVLIVYLTQTSALWCSLLIYKLHLLAVWRADFIDRHYRWFVGFCWIFPLAFAIPVAVKNLAEYPGIGFSCLVSTDNLNTYLFYPTAVYMYPAMVCHVVTVGKMIHLAVMSSKIDTGLSQLSTDARMKVTTTMQAKRLLRGQWRPALMMGTVMTSLTVFWLFYFVDAHRLADIKPDSPLMLTWLQCVAEGAKKGLSSNDTQALCAKGAKPFLPSIPWFTSAEMLLAIIGIVVALVFISKSEFWEEWACLLSNLFTRGKSGNGSSRGRRSPDGSSSPTLTNGRHMDEMRKGSVGQAGGGRNNNTPAHLRGDNKSMSSKNLTTGPDNSQWYDMDDLLDKEYQDQQRMGVQRNLSVGSRAGMTSHSGPNPTSDPPHYNNPADRHGDLLYRPPVSHEATPTHWIPSAHTLTNPSRAYLGASDNERYIDQPVVPSPVPRTPKMGHQQVFLSNSVASSSSPPNSGSLSPMPPKSPTHGSFGGNRHPLDSVPIIGVATRGSPAQASSYPSSPSSQKSRANMYNSNESGDMIMMASREGMAKNQGYNPSIRVNTAVERARSPPPPSVPHRNPARHQPGYMSPPLHSPTSPSNPYRD